MADLSRNCKGFRARESVHARDSCDRVTRAGDGRWPRYQVKSLACPICVFINLWWTLNRSNQYTFSVADRQCPASLTMTS